MGTTTKALSARHQIRKSVAMRRHKPGVPHPGAQSRQHGFFDRIVLLSKGQRQANKFAQRQRLLGVWDVDVMGEAYRQNNRLRMAKIVACHPICESIIRIELSISQFPVGPGPNSDAVQQNSTAAPMVGRQRWRNRELISFSADVSR